MKRTIKVAAVKRFYSESHDQLWTHTADFTAVWNFGRRLKTLGGLTPYEYVASIGTFCARPINVHPMLGLNTWRAWLS